MYRDITLKNLFKILGLLWMSYPLCSVASTTHTKHTTKQAPHVELSAYLGGTYIPNTIDGQTLELLPYEIGPYADTFVDQSDAGAFTWGLDAKYRFKLHQPAVHNYILESVGVGLGVYQITNFEQTGDVLQFGMPEFENYTYVLMINSARLMADFDLEFHPIGQKFIPFIEGGIGAANTSVSYKSYPIAPLDSPNFTIPKETTWSFAYQVGAGVKYVINTHFILSLHYLYANMGDIDSSTSGSSTTLAAPLTVDMSTHNFLFGFTYAL